MFSCFPVRTYYFDFRLKLLYEVITNMNSIDNMKFKLFLSALTNYRNVGIFAILAGLSMYGSQYLGEMSYVAYIGAFAAYIGCSLQSLTSKKFQDKLIHKSKQEHIRNLNEMCAKLANDTKKHTNSAYYKKLCSIMEDKTEIINEYSKGDTGFLKERITEHTLNLVITYLKMLKNFCIRSRELNLTDVGPIMDRIGKNTRKLNFINDPKVYEDLKKTIEMDEKIIARLKEEKHDLERIDTKLDYIKSTVSMFKHQIGHSLESEEMLEKIENVVNEATALESVLDERQKRRSKNTM